MNETQHIFMMGSLDIEHVVGIVASFSSNLKEIHMTSMKNIFIYLKWTEYYGLLYKQDDDFNLKV